MNKNILDYLMDLKNRYSSVSIIQSDTEYIDLEIIPIALKDFYKDISEAELPFGRIFKPSIAWEQSKNNPFSPDWFVFGQDSYFSFWLCSYSPDEEGLSFTYWDHESGNKIDGAVWPDLQSFLQDLEEEYINEM